jgi:hypothetical protein|tara:strand:- start:326 stop:670 length:345 start_codon:yes stop_codon:yes gene_type:complete
VILFNKFYLTEVGNASGHFDRPKNGPDILAIGQPLGKLRGAGGFKGAAQIGVPDDLTIFVPNLNKKRCSRCEAIRRKRDKVSPNKLDAQSTVNQATKDSQEFPTMNSGTGTGWF